MRRHMKSRFPQLNHRRLAETFATDTLFSSETARGGVTCAQLFCGQKSLFTSVYGMKTENEGTAALEDFIHEHGAPNTLRNDNAKMQTGTAWVEILQKYGIKAEHTEPHHPHQNPAERRIKTVKEATRRVLDRSGAPGTLWYLAMLYVVFLLNRVAVESLGWRTPTESCFGETPDVSSLMQFSFYEKVYFLDPDAKFPDTSERLGYFVGIAENKGDDLTFWVLTQDTDQLLAR